MYQIPHSAFLAWDKDDRDKAIWQYIRDKQTCRGCGTRAAEWNPSEGGHRHAYFPVLDRCPGCEPMAYFREALDDKHTGKGSFVRLQPRG